MRVAAVLVTSYIGISPRTANHAYELAESGEFDLVYFIGQKGVRDRNQSMSNQKISNFMKPVSQTQGSPHAAKKPGQLTPELQQMKKDFIASKLSGTPTKLSQASPAKSPQVTPSADQSSPGNFFARTTENISRYDISTSTSKSEKTPSTSVPAKKAAGVSGVSQIIRQLQKSNPANSSPPTNSKSPSETAHTGRPGAPSSSTQESRSLSKQPAGQTGIFPARGGSAAQAISVGLSPPIPNLTLSVPVLSLLPSPPVSVIQAPTTSFTAPKTNSVMLPEVVEVISPVKKRSNTVFPGSSNTSASTTSATPTIITLGKSPSIVTVENDVKPTLSQMHSGLTSRSEEPTERSRRPRSRLNAQAVAQPAPTIVPVSEILGLPPNPYRPRQASCSVCFKEGPFLDGFYHGEQTEFIFGKRGEVEGHISCLLATPDETKDELYKHENVKITIRVWKPTHARKFTEDPNMKCAVCESHQGYMNCSIQKHPTNSFIKPELTKAHLVCAAFNTGLHLVGIQNEYIFQEIGPVQDKERLYCQYCIERPIKGQPLKCSAEEGCKTAHLICSLNHKISVLMRLQAKNLPIESNLESPDTMKRKYGSPGQTIMELGWYFSYHATPRMITPLKLAFDNTNSNFDQLPVEFLRFMGLEKLGISAEHRQIMKAVLEERLKIKQEVMLPDTKTRATKRSGPNFLCASHSTGAPIICSCGLHDPRNCEPQPCSTCGDWFHPACIVNREPTLSNITDWMCGFCRVKQSIQAESICSLIKINKSAEGVLKFPTDSPKDQNLKLSSALSLVSSLFQDVRHAADGIFPQELHNFLNHVLLSDTDMTSPKTKVVSPDSPTVELSRMYPSPNLDLCTLLQLRPLIPINLSGVFQIHYFWRHALFAIDDLLVATLCKLHPCEALTKDETLGGPSVNELCALGPTLSAWLEQIKSWKLFELLLLPNETPDVFLRCIRELQANIQTVSEFQSTVKIGRATMMDYTSTLTKLQAWRPDFAPGLKTYLQQMMDEASKLLTDIQPYEILYQRKAKGLLVLENFSDPAAIMAQLAPLTIEKFYQSNRFVKQKAETQDLVKATKLASLRSHKKEPAAAALVWKVANFFITNQAATVEKALREFIHDLDREKQASFLLKRLQACARGLSQDYVLVDELHKVTVAKTSDQKADNQEESESFEDDLSDSVHFDGKCVKRLKNILKNRNCFKLPTEQSSNIQCKDLLGFEPCPKTKFAMALISNQLPLTSEDRSLIQTWNKLLDAKKMLRGLIPIKCKELPDLLSSLTASKVSPEVSLIVNQLTELQNAISQINSKSFPTQIIEGSRMQTVTKLYRQFRSLNLVDSLGRQIRKKLDSAVLPLLVMSTLLVISEEQTKPSGEINLVGEISDTLASQPFPEIVSSPNFNLMTFLCQRPWFEMQGLEYYPKIRDYLKRLYSNLLHYSIERCITPMNQGVLIPSIPRPYSPLSAGSRLHIGGLLFTGELILALNQKYGSQQHITSLSKALGSLFTTQDLSEDNIQTLKALQEKFDNLRAFIKDANTLACESFDSIPDMVSRVKDVYRRRKLYVGIPTNDKTKYPELIRWLDGAKAVTKFLELINKFSDKTLTEKNQRLYISLSNLLADKQQWNNLPLPASELNSYRFQDFAATMAEVQHTIKEFDALKLEIEKVQGRILDVRSVPQKSTSFEKVLLAIQSLPDVSVAGILRNKVLRIPCISMINTDLDRGSLETQRIEEYIDEILHDEKNFALPLLLKAENYHRFSQLIEMLCLGRSSNTETRMFSNMYFSNIKLLGKLSVLWVIYKVITFIMNLTPNFQVLLQDAPVQAAGTNPDKPEIRPIEESIFEDSTSASHSALMKAVFGSRLYTPVLEKLINHCSVAYYLQQILARFHELVVRILRGQGAVCFIESVLKCDHLTPIDTFDTLLRSWARGAFKVSGVDCGELSTKQPTGILGQNVLENTVTEISMATAVLGKAMAPMLGIDIAGLKQNYSNCARILWEDFIDMVKRVSFAYQAGRFNQTTLAKTPMVKCAADAKIRNKSTPTLQAFLAEPMTERIRKYTAVGMVPEKVLQWVIQTLTMPEMLQLWGAAIMSQDQVYKDEVEAYIKLVRHLNLDEVIPAFEEVKYRQDARIELMNSISTQIKFLQTYPHHEGFKGVFDQLMEVRYAIDNEKSHLMFALVDAEASLLRICPPTKAMLEMKIPRENKDKDMPEWGWGRVQTFFKMLGEYVNYLNPNLSELEQLAISKLRKPSPAHGSAFKLFTPKLPHPSMTKATSLLKVAYSLHKKLAIELAKSEVSTDRIASLLPKCIKLPSSIRGLQLPPLPCFPQVLIDEQGLMGSRVSSAEPGTAIHRGTVSEPSQQSEPGMDEPANTIPTAPKPKTVVEMNVIVSILNWRDQFNKNFEENFNTVVAEMPEKLRKKMLTSKKEIDNKPSSNSKMVEENPTDELSDPNRSEFDGVMIPPVTLGTMVARARNFVREGVEFQPSEQQELGSMKFMIKFREYFRPCLTKLGLIESEIGLVSSVFVEAIKKRELNRDFAEIYRSLNIIRRDESTERMLRSPDMPYKLLHVVKEMPNYVKLEALEKRRSLESEQDSSEPLDRSLQSDSRDRSTTLQLASCRPALGKRIPDLGELPRPSGANSQEDSTSSQQGILPQQPEYRRIDPPARRRSQAPMSPEAGQKPLLWLPNKREAVPCQAISVTPGSPQSFPSNMQLDDMEGQALERILQELTRISSFGYVRCEARIEGPMRCELPEGRTFVIFPHRGTPFGARLGGGMESLWAREPLAFLILRKPSIQSSNPGLTRLVRESDRTQPNGGES